MATATPSVLQANTVTCGPASSITGGLRSAPTPGNLVVAAFFQNDGTEATLHGPAGWNYIGRVANGVGDVDIALYWHVVASGEANAYTFTGGGPGMPRSLGLNLTEIGG
ncbi:MAG: hypothetical protein JO359_05960, partial [Candidatus Eremiobacteraeota bacterium]|nr:hypothetical protein [Candidatus Eremiobacteraeota bacterium]